VVATQGDIWQLINDQQENHVMNEIYNLPDRNSLILWRSITVFALMCGFATYTQAKTETFILKSNVTYGDEGIYFNTDQGKVALNLYTMPEKVVNALHTYNLNKGACIQVSSVKGFKAEDSGGSGIQSISNCPASTSSKALLSQASAAKSRFNIFNKPNVVSLGRCHMDECTWSKSMTTRVIQLTASETLLKVTLLGATSDNPDSDSKKPPKLVWNKAPHDLVIRCSYQRPTITMDNESDRLPLNANGVPGYLESSASLYFKYCHSDLTSSDPIRKYGYNAPDIQE
jgi:hypothetical protein